jgi:hypothetical protein
MKIDFTMYCIHVFLIHYGTVKYGWRDKKNTGYQRKRGRRQLIQTPAQSRKVCLHGE